MDTDQAKALLIKSKLYRYMSMALVAVGFGLFCMIYFKMLHGDFIGVIKNPAQIIMLLFPFLPAVILSWMSRRVEIKLSKLVDESK